MARKKKVEEPVEEEIKTVELSDELKEKIDEAMGFVNTATTTTGDSVDSVSMDSTFHIGETMNAPYRIGDVENTTRLTTIQYLKENAIREIDRCSAYVFSGRDKAFGRVFELSRVEWCDYYIALEYCERKPDAPLPKTPSRQIEPK